MRRGILFFIFVTMTALGFASPAWTAPGDLDDSFAGNGTLYGTPGRGFVNVAVQPDGKIIVAETDTTTQVYTLVLSRYHPNGSLDTTFGDGDGTAETGLDAGIAQNIALQANGKIVVAGSKGWESKDGSDCEPGCMALARFNEDGSVDTSFGGGDGRAHTSLGSWYSSGGPLAFQPDGKIVLGGTAIGDEDPDDDNKYDFALVRFNTDGTLDTTFDGDGKLTTPVNTSYDGSVAALHVDPDGKIVAAGINGGLAIARYNADGTLDASYDEDGKRVTPLGEDGVIGVEGFIFQPDGKIVLGGLVFGDPHPDRGYNYDFALARYTADGALDTTFGGDGKVSTDLGTYSDQVKSLLVQPDGKIVAGGWSVGRGTYNEETNSSLALARYTADGVLDTAFGGGDGTVTGGIYSFRNFALQPDGGIVATGRAGDELPAGKPALTRYYGGEDATAPGAVTGFGATSHGGDSSLSWTNPTDADFGATRVLRSTSGYAANATQTAEQTRVYEGRDTSYLDAALSKGTYYYTAFARDTNGNWSTVARATVESTPPPPPDNTTPETALNAWTNSPSPPNVTFGFESSEPNSTFECRLDDGPFEGCTSYKLYNGLSHGEHTFYVRAIDPAGNVDPTPASRAWMVDARGPEVTITSGPSGTVSAGSARFEFSTDEPAYELLCELDNGGDNPCDSPKTYSNLTNGEHTFSVQAVDEFGNQGAIVTRTWTVAPESKSEELDVGGTLTTDAEGDGATSSDPLEISITSPTGGTVSVEETVDTAPAPAGYAFFGQQANITAPAATPENPLRFAFRLDASLVPAGEDENSIRVFRNGEPLEPCADRSGTASPNPCVFESQRLADGDLEFTVLTSAASYWNLGVADSRKPTVEDVDPNNGAVGVSRTISPMATFSEGMKPNTLTTSTVKLQQYDKKTKKWKTVPATVTLSDSGTKVILDPLGTSESGTTEKPLVARTKFRVTITTGARDLALNPLARNFVWTFTTGGGT
jgi:uncharacterized delta-60 repeat protein